MLLIFLFIRFKTCIADKLSPLFIAASSLPCLSCSWFRRCGRQKQTFYALTFTLWLSRFDQHFQPGAQYRSVLHCWPVGSLLCRLLCLSDSTLLLLMLNSWAAARSDERKSPRKHASVSGNTAELNIKIEQQNETASFNGLAFVFRQMF